MPNHLESTRRSFILSLTASCAGLLSAQTLAGVEGLHEDMAKSIKSLKIFDSKQIEALAAMVEVIIPRTDTPGAKEAGVHYFIDNELACCVSESERALFIAQFNSLVKIVYTLYGKPFDELDVAIQNTVMHQIVAAKSPFPATSLAFFKQLKSLTMLGYYTSKIGASVELAYLPIPGGYDGNFKLKDIGRAWDRIF
ncbi:MAG: hypothetical protein ACI93R_001097 [Flavobacteriales bacterium]|jgi:hypothetical protein